MTVVAVVEPLRVPGLPLMPASVRRAIVGRPRPRTRAGTPMPSVTRPSAAHVLERAGWSVRARVREGRPLADLLAATEEAAAHVLVVGTRGVGGVERLLLGSVAEGALTRSAVSVLVAR